MLNIVVQGLMGNNSLWCSYLACALYWRWQTFNARAGSYHNAGINADQPYGVCTTSLDAGAKSVSHLRHDHCPVVSAVQMLINAYAFGLYRL